MNPLLRNKFKT